MRRKRYHARCWGLGGIHGEKQGEITEQTRQRLVAEAERNFPTMEKELRQVLEISATKKWEEEAEAKKQAFEETMKKDFKKQLIDELRAKVKAEVRKELLAGLGQ